jgi:putative Holliday junction resolvase
VVDQVAAAGILQHAIDMQKARGTDVGIRVTAPPHPRHSGDSAPDIPAHSAPEDTIESSDNGRLQ